MKNSYNLVVANDMGSDLASIAKAFYAAIGIDDFTERESGNYPGGRYFRGRAPNITFLLMETEHGTHTDRPFWARIELQDEFQGEFDLDQWVRQKLVANGFQVAQMINFHRHGEERREIA
jgi:hypothetical protein